jgi:hypothetical protein
MTAPELIWAWGTTSEGEIAKNARPSRWWFDHGDKQARDSKHCTEYVRADIADDLLAALKAMRTVMDNGDKPAKLEDALTWRQCDEKARAMCDAAIAKAEGTA